MESVIETIGLTKRFVAGRGYRDLLPLRRRRYVEALRSVDLRVPRGIVFGVLGPNGAGKTTLFKVLGTLILPTSGQARVLGMDVARRPTDVKRVITYVINDERSLLWRLNGRQNLEYFAALWNLHARDARRRIDELLVLLGLEAAADQRVMYYSTGMRQKLLLARGLLPDPEVLLLDEPTRSLDPLVARSLWRFIHEELVARRGKTVLVATHNMDEARRECQQVAILHRGQVRASGSVEELTTVLGGAAHYTLALHPGSNGIATLLSSLPGVTAVRVLPVEDGEPHTFDVGVDNPSEHVPLLLERVIASGAKVLACAPRERALVDVLAELTGEAKP